MTREEKKIEAIARMKTLGIMEDAINQFDKEDKLMQSIEGFMYWIDEDTENDIFAKVKEFEKEYDAVVYYVITTNTEFGLLYSFLYVGNEKEEWEYDREDIADGYCMSYVYNATEPMFSEFGTIAVKERFGGLVRVG